MDPTWLPNTSKSAPAKVVDCIARLRSESSPTEFGYKIQALAAHVLVGLNHQVVEVNSRGHPDIVSIKHGREYRFEVEAEVVASKRRMLTSSDFEALIDDTRVAGYFALAISFPKPYWLLVPAQRLARRNSPSGNALLEALSDKAFSTEWTCEYLSLVERSCREMLDRSFNQLVRRAKRGFGL